MAPLDEAQRAPSSSPTSAGRQRCAWLIHPDRLQPFPAPGEHQPEPGRPHRLPAAAPFTLNELPAGTITDPDQWILTGGYPPLFDGRTGRDDWFANTSRTYVNARCGLSANITDLHAFERFLRLCAGRVGQLLNRATWPRSRCRWQDHRRLAERPGEQFIIHLLRPHHISFNKRVVKMPAGTSWTPARLRLAGHPGHGHPGPSPFPWRLVRERGDAELRKLAGHQVGWWTSILAGQQRPGGGPAAGGKGAAGAAGDQPAAPCAPNSSRVERWSQLSGDARRRVGMRDSSARNAAMASPFAMECDR